MPVCVAGVHRSGTSMVARLLNLCGLDLGADEDLIPPSPDNRDGHWEHRSFVRLNDEILALRGGGWDTPVDGGGDWHLDSSLQALRARAAALVQGFEGREPWGWKDPRTSLTYPFWKSLLPNLRVVVCLRNPLEVHDSLNRRSSASEAFSYKLWEAYYRQILVDAGDAVLTHYVAYFFDPRAELRRVLELVGMSASDEFVDRACSAAKSSLRHSRVQDADLFAAELPKSLRHLYTDLRAASGPVAQLALRDEAAALEAAPEDASEHSRQLALLRLEGRLAEQAREIDKLRRALGQLEHERNVGAGQMEDLSTEFAASRAELDLMRASWPVRFAAPLRTVRDTFRRMRTREDAKGTG